MRGMRGVQTYYMNCLPNNTSERTSGSSQVVVALIATETTVLSTTGNTPISGLTVEEKLQRRAEAMTDVLTEIMDRPVAQRFWGLNE